MKWVLVRCSRGRPRPESTCCSAVACRIQLKLSRSVEVHVVWCDESLCDWLEVADAAGPADRGPVPKSMHSDKPMCHIYNLIVTEACRIGFDAAQSGFTTKYITRTTQATRASFVCIHETDQDCFCRDAMPHRPGSVQCPDSPTSARLSVRQK